MSTILAHAGLPEGYPGLNNPRLEIKSAVNPASIVTQDAPVHYIADAASDRKRFVAPDVEWQIDQDMITVVDNFMPGNYS